MLRISHFRIKKPFDLEPCVVTGNAEQLCRRVNNRQTQLMAIGGSIGTVFFISIGTALYEGGPLSLLLVLIFYSSVMALVNTCAAEMIVLRPDAGGFIRMARHWVDEALGFAAGWDFFFTEALTIPFEITALNLFLIYWRDDIPVAAVLSVCIVIYAALNILAGRAYGEAEFCLSGGKVLLILIMVFFAFITMVVGNPEHDAYGFRYWSIQASRLGHLLIKEIFQGLSPGGKSEY